MTTKQIGYYTEALDSGAGDLKLAMEICGSELACIASREGSVCGIELFTTEGEWEPVFAALGNTSRILGKSFAETVCYHNSEEVLVVPVKKFDTVAAEDYLSLVYGERYQHDVKHDVLARKAQVTAYHIDRSLHDAIRKRFVLCQPRHVYTAVLDNLLTREQLPPYLVHLQGYENMVILTLVKNGQLQLIRSLHYKTPEDVLYYLISIIQQFPVVRKHAHLEISGRMREEVVDAMNPKKLFGEIRYSLPGNNSHALAEAISAYPAHYFTPLFNMAL